MFIHVLLLSLALLPLSPAAPTNTTTAILSTSSRLTDVVSPDFMPAPWLDNLSICYPSHSSSHHASAAVCDPSGLLSPHNTDTLDSLLSKILSGRAPYSLVSCPQDPTTPQTGFRVAVALVRRMTYDGRTLSQRAENFAHVLFDRWGLSANCGASVLLFLSLEDRRMYIQTGRLATKYLNEHQIDAVYKRMIPHLSQNRVYKALDVGLSEIASYLSKYSGAHAGGVDTHSPPSGVAMPLFFRGGPAWWDLELSIVFIIFMVFAVFACCNGIGGTEATRRKRERRQVLRKLNIVKSEYVAAMLPQYTPATCPFCHDDLTPPWVPTVPTLPDTSPLIEEEEPVTARPVRKLRCGHMFHESCFDDEHPTPSGTIPDCPVCGDRAGGVSTPPSLNSTRAQDAAFRVQKLAEEYPHILTDAVIAKLSSETPNLWPESMTEWYLRPVVRERGMSDAGYAGNSGGGGWFGGLGGLLAAGGLGALIGSTLSGWGGRSEAQSNYTNIPAANAGGHVGQWIGGTGTQGGGGHGAGWGNALSGAASRMTGGGGGGLGAGWGGWSGGGGGGGGGGGHGSGW